MPHMLWTAFPEDTLSAMPFDEAQQLALIDIFDLWDEESPWRQALAALQLPAPDTETDIVLFYKNRPYINTTVLAGLVSCGTVKVVEDAAGGYRFKPRFSIAGYIRLFRLQWRLTQYVQEILQQENLPEDRDAALAQSLALGLCMQALMLRLNARARDKLPQYLADPKTAPAAQRMTILQLQQIQLRRTKLSPVWHDMFVAPRGMELAEVPAFFWDHPTDIASVAAPVQSAATTAQMLFHGMPVTGGQVSGLAVVMVSDDLPAEKPADKCVFVFRHARPEAVEAYAMADAVLFADGGVLSHACVVAREQGLPCITGLGADFYTRMKSADAKTWLAIDGAAASVRVIEG